MEEKLKSTISKILKETGKENANIRHSPASKMLQIASEVSKEFALETMPQEFAQAHKEGRIHIHDLDFYYKTLTCLQIPLGSLLENGFNPGNGFIRPPKTIRSAMALSAIILQCNQNDMHGGQSYATFDRDMGPYCNNATKPEIYQACEAFVHNLNSMHSRAGAQVPFTSINIGTDTTWGGRSITEGILKAFDAGLGKGETPLFPNIIFKIKDGVNRRPGDPNYDLFKLAIKVAAKRMNPTFSFLDSTFNKAYGDEVSYMGCRTRVLANMHGEEVATGRGNLSFTSINIPRVAIESVMNINNQSYDDILEYFWIELGELADLAMGQLYERYKVQSNLRVKDMPFLMGQGLYMGSEDLAPNDIIEPAAKNGTLSMGFIGLAEATKMLTGSNHAEDSESLVLAEEIVKFLRAKCDFWAKTMQLNYTLLATPAEGLSFRFLNKDRQKFGVIKDITDKDYYTNSFHVPVSMKIPAHKKIEIESIFHKYTNAGHISYIELPSSPLNNLDALEAMLNYAADEDMGYMGFNFPLDQCKDCYTLGTFDGECPACGSERILMTRRITGYLGHFENFGIGKSAEARDRVAHGLQ